MRLRKSSGLVGHWKFNEKSGTVANDSSRYHNTGTLTGGPKWGEKGIIFDGVDDCVRIPYNNIGGTLTYSLWTKSSISGGGYRMFSYMSTLLQLAGNDITFFPNTISGSITTKPYTVVNDVWYNIIITHTGTTTEIFVNGVSLGSNVDQAINTVDGNTNVIGAYFTMGNYYNGSIDEVRIYNRALSADEIKRLYERTRILFGV